MEHSRSMVDEHSALNNELGDAYGLSDDDIIEFDMITGEENAQNCGSPIEEIYYADVEESDKSDDDIEPCIDMEFDNENDAYDVYNRYAKRMGFCVRKSRTYKSKKSGLVIHREYCCSKEGQISEGINQVRPSKREGCMAKMTIKKRKDSEKWYIAKFDNNHCHDLFTPSKLHLVQTQKDIVAAKKCLLDSFNAPGIRTRDMMNYLAKHSGGISNIGFTEKIARNYIGRGKLKNTGIDSHTLLEYFKNMQAKNSGFFYAIQLDQDDHLSNVFWIDAKSRHAYQHFGDVVSFDTTYRKNKFLMPFAPFVGVNHHRQTILFGCALLSNETEETFVWLFQTWLNAMFDCPPQSIITDQDRAMRAAIQQVFPNTTHFFCKWHICKKLGEKLSHVFHRHKNFAYDFHTCVNVNGIEEFELAWNDLLNKYELNDNEWLKSIYDDRKQWIPSYVKNVFCAGMSTTGRSESINKFFKDYVHSKTTLSEFVEQYERALDRRYEAEVQADFVDINTKPILKLNAEIEKKAAEIYTRSNFEKFQQEYLNSTQCPVMKVNDDRSIKVYHVHKFLETKVYTVKANISESEASCSCKMFEFDGILCKHVLAVFRENNIFWLPERYILTRWRKDCKKQDVSDIPNIQNASNKQESQTLMYNMICVEAIKIADKWAINASTFEEVLSILRKAQREVIELNTRATNVQNSFQMFENNGNNLMKKEPSSSSMRHITIRDPAIAITKGRQPSNKRIKSPLEEPTRKKRTCGICGEKGHNNRTCKIKDQSVEGITQEHQSQPAPFDESQCS